MKTRRMTELALLTAAALIIFIVELRLPDLSSIPGVKLGLANIFTVYVVYSYKAKEAALMLLTRILLGSLFSNNFSSVIYSLAGGMLCIAGMLLLKKVIPINYLWLCSVFGAMFHNTGQIAAALLLTRSAAVLIHYPLLIVSGCIAGLFTGLCAQFVLKRLMPVRKNGEFNEETTMKENEK
ncbi:MAG: Gx transporter family protein [Ruminococcus sp.]|nr:Gx transporter family protein [Ruminococcus sp.]